MNIDQLEITLQRIVARPQAESFIYDLLKAYGHPMPSITRLKKGDYNLVKDNSGDLLWKKKVYYKSETTGDLHALIDKLSKDKSVIKHHPRFVIVTDFETLLSIDAKTSDTLDIPFIDLPKHYDFFLPWAGMEKTRLQNEKLADIKAAERMGRLYDIILKENTFEDNQARRSLNIFLSRLLFCFFAEDTGIFEDSLFTNSVASHTLDDGSDLEAYLHKLFKVVNLENRSEYPKYLQKFPYVNGGLFAEEHPIPKLSAQARRIMIECGSLNWKEINPDIFGSMMQAVVHADQRSSLGMHYTSIVNIMKVIKPLFLDNLYEELGRAGRNDKRLAQLLKRIYNLRIFDPACGSGNFLIIAYKELCKLEIEIFKRRYNGQISSSILLANRIRLSQFYGIEIDDFAHQTAKLSLWLAEHQMNIAFKEVFGETKPTLPLKDSGNILCENATKLDWVQVCPKDEDAEIYILGNPPYLGSRYQLSSHKSDIANACGGLPNYKKVDYIVCWLVKAARYSTLESIHFAFVTTNSICQGEQVAVIWPYLFREGFEIKFAYQSFKWRNSAKGNAGVTCAIIGLGKVSSTKASKRIYSPEGRIHHVKNISPYLIEGPNTIVNRRSKPLALFPKMESGNKATDGGHLILSKQEKNTLVQSCRESNQLLRRVYGAYEFLNGTEKWCLWINDGLLDLAKTIPQVFERIEKVRETRLQSKDSGARKLSNKPHQFREMKESKKLGLICPTVSSERREYIPIGYLSPSDVIIAPNQAIYDPPPWIFAAISSRMHMTWVRAVAGRLKTDYRYSSALCYNTFPFPNISEFQKTVLEDHAFKVLEEREHHSEKTIAQLYDPDKMPKGLKKAHYEMDLAVERCYRKQPFKDDEERLEYLFRLYEEMIQAEKRQGQQECLI